MKTNTLTAKLNSLSKEEQLKFLQKLETTVALGLRSLILKNLKKEDLAEFEKVAQDGGDDELFIFARKHIPNFDEKYLGLMNQIYSKIS